MIFELNVAFLVILTQKIVKNYQKFSEKILKIFQSVENKNLFCSSARTVKYLVIVYNTVSKNIQLTNRLVLKKTDWTNWMSKLNFQIVLLGVKK